MVQILDFKIHICLDTTGTCLIFHFSVFYEQYCRKNIFFKSFHNDYSSLIHELYPNNSNHCQTSSLFITRFVTNISAYVNAQTCVANGTTLLISLLWLYKWLYAYINVANVTVDGCSQLWDDCQHVNISSTIRDDYRIFMERLTDLGYIVLRDMVLREGLRIKVDPFPSGKFFNNVPFFC